MTTTPTERRLAITPDPMTTDKNKVSELLVSDENAPPLSTEYVTRIAKEVHAEAPNTESACIGIALAVRDIYDIECARLRQERDELVGALEATWNALEASPCDPDITADQIAAHAELKKHDVPALLSKHKPQ